MVWGDVVMNHKALNLKLSGNEFEDQRYNIHYMIEGLKCSQKIFEQAYLFLIDRKNISASDRENIKIYAKDIKDGSFESDLIIFLKDASVSLFSMYSVANAKELWELVKNSYDYLKAILTANIKEEKTVYNITDSPGVTIVNSNDGVIVSANRDVVGCANEIYPYLKRFSQTIDEKGGFKGYSLSDKENEKEKLRITKKEKEIFKNEYVLDENEVKFKGIYANASVSTFGGKIEITDPLDSNLTKQFYNFDFVDKGNEQLYRAGYVHERTYLAFKKLRFDIGKLTNEVVGLRIIKVK